MEIALGILLLVFAVFLIAAILMQHGKSHNLSGTIAVGAETFFGKTKGTAFDAVLGNVVQGAFGVVLGTMLAGVIAKTHVLKKFNSYAV